MRKQMLTGKVVFKMIEYLKIFVKLIHYNILFYTKSKKVEFNSRDFQEILI